MQVAVVNRYDGHMPRFLRLVRPSAREADNSLISIDRKHRWQNVYSIGGVAGVGIQHVAFLTDDLLKTWDALKACGTKFMTAPPETYYEMLEGRLPNHGEPTEELRKRGILLDGASENGDRPLLLQIFSETSLGPVFFEFIQRKGDSGFGEGNFKARFESIERDQIKRGVLEAN